MKHLVPLFFVILPYLIAAQTEEDSLYISFLQSSGTKKCLSALENSHVSELFESNTVYINNHRISMERKTHEYYEIDPYGLCNEYRSVFLHHHLSNGIEYMFVYRRFSESKDQYGELQLYSKIEDEWKMGQILNLEWHNFFSISQDEIDRLRNLQQYPKFLVEFKKEGMAFTIPWEIYSFDQGSEMNGYVKGRGSQPILISYDSIIP